MNIEQAKAIVKAMSRKEIENVKHVEPEKVTHVKWKDTSMYCPPKREMVSRNDNLRKYMRKNLIG